MNQTNQTCNGKHKTLESLFECKDCAQYFDGPNLPEHMTALEVLADGTQIILEDQHRGLDLSGEASLIVRPLDSRHGVTIEHRKRRAWEPVDRPEYTTKIGWYSESDSGIAEAELMTAMLQIATAYAKENF